MKRLAKARRIIRPSAARRARMRKAERFERISGDAEARSRFRSASSSARSTLQVQVVCGA